MQKITFNFKNSHKIIQKIGLIDEFKGKWSQQISTDLPLEKLRMLALSDNSSASVRLEKQSPIASANDAQRNLYRNAAHIALNQATLFSYQTIEHLYELLETQVTNHDFEKYRKPSPKLTFFISEQPLSFRTIPTRNIAQQLKQEVQKTIAYLEEKQFHPLIVIADFLYEFIAICPFETCNLQLSRLIAQQLLVQLNYNFIEYSAFEAAFEARKEPYNVALAKALSSRNQAKEDISEWILFFLECIELSINHLEHRLKPLQAALKLLNTEHAILNEANIEKPVKKQVTALKVEKPISNVAKTKKEKPRDAPVAKNGKDKTKIIMDESTTNGKNVELPFGELVEDKTTKSVDNQSIKSEHSNTTTLNNHAEFNEMVDNPIQMESDSDKLSPRQKKIKKFIIERQPTCLGDLKKAFPEMNQHIIKKDLQYMHRLNEIQKLGDLKSTVYMVNE